MRTYIRAKLTGGLYFFTVNLADRHNNDCLVSNIELLRDAFRLTKQQHPFIIEACVILPEHLHCIWRLIKTHFSKNIALTERISNSRKRKKERGIWQRRFWETEIMRYHFKTGQPVILVSWIGGCADAYPPYDFTINVGWISASASTF